MSFRPGRAPRHRDPDRSPATELEPVLRDELESACGLSLAWFDVLGQLHLAATHRLTMTELANAVLVSKSGLTRRIDRMEKAGLVQRMLSPDDRRSVLITLTEAGAEKHLEALPIHLDTVKRHFAAYIQDSEAAAVEAALARMATAARAELRSDKNVPG